ncbi:MAG: S9 family peptidase, partial [Candidatus Aminicenantes bacterium]|nr:S9 family peptidase [Candidatus Aminicenantes bacterium]
MKDKRWIVLVISGLLTAGGVWSAQDRAERPLLTLESIFAGRDFAPERFGPARWMRDGESYTTLEPNAALKGGRDIALYRADSGKRDVLVPAPKLVPGGASAPLAID